ncbi:MAG: hypothetical protein KDB14_21960 [Planctomycetales bacterium]|nr:hypothetical protein [Planctomycetales bacterium]
MTAVTQESQGVSRFEYDLLRITAGLLAETPHSPFASRGNHTRAKPKCLGAEAVRLLKDTLAKGVVRFFASRGWRSESHLRSDQIRQGPVWLRTPASQLGLTFSPHTVDFLIDLVRESPEQVAGWCPRRETPLAIGDRLVIFLAVRAIQHQPGGAIRWSSPAVTGDGLSMLMYPDAAVASVSRNVDEGASGVNAPDFAPWTTGVGGCLLETLQRDVTGRWLAIERQKRQISKCSEMTLLGRSQRWVLEAFFDQLERVRRWDLATGMLAALGGLMTPDVLPQHWIGKLRMGSMRLADRAEVYNEAFAFLRSSLRMQRWHNRALGVGFVDEDYEAAQLWKEIWESLGGSKSVEAVQRIVESTQF